MSRLRARLKCLEAAPVGGQSTMLVTDIGAARFAGVDVVQIP